MAAVFGWLCPVDLCFLPELFPSVHLATGADEKKHSKRTAKKCLTFAKNAFIKPQAEEQFINPKDGILTEGKNVPGVIQTEFYHC